MENFSDILKLGLPWLELDLEFPFREMHEEAKAVRDLFVSHRYDDSAGANTHKGWNSLCIHGISSQYTNHYTSYGYKSNEETPYKWTEISERCPITTKFLKETYPIEEFYRVRFMLLEAGGYILPHVDMEKNILSPVNLALNTPKECIFKMENDGIVPLETGKMVMLNVSNTHAIWNKSSEDRYHMIIHGKQNEAFRALGKKSYEKR